MLYLLLLAIVGLCCAQKKPNVIVIMADDQDLRLDSMSVMPNVRDKIAANGVFYEKHYCTVAW